MTIAASSDGKAKSIARIVNMKNQVNIGTFDHVMPGALIHATVMRKLTLPTVLETISMIRPAKASVGPGPGLKVEEESGAYVVQPTFAAPPGRKKQMAACSPPKTYNQEPRAWSLGRARS